MVANPVTLRPMFEADEAMKEVGGAGYLATAHRLGRGADRRQGFRTADLRPRACFGR
jgi:hypothetical protein